MAEEVLVDLGVPGARLLVRLGEHVAAWSPDPDQASWRHAEIVVEAAPFSGTIPTILTGTEVGQYREALAALDRGDRADVRLGGDRAAEIRLERTAATVVVTATPSGDDPWPTIRYLVPRP
ncbi:hypothetical protein [Actinomycetospora atypica]|uniref:Uncharacterized protein n=1 Tax=Actinomycetospora atypica TaxID=1290095 RepID=A0ABV9YG45_9PSEU